jgi:DNA-binding CsgD family transcriptional regulator/PAS domain-containing protein
MLTIIRNTPLPALLVDLPAGRIAAANVAVATLLAVPVGESLIGRSATDLAVDPGAGRRAMALVLDGHIDGFWRAHRLLRRLDGSTVAADVWFTASAAHHPPRFAVVVGVEARDEPRVGDVLETRTHDNLNLLGVVGGAWQLLQISETVTNLLGYCAEDVLGKSFLDLVHPEDVPELLMTLGSAASEPRMSRTHLRLLGSERDWTLCTVHITLLAGSDLPAFAFIAQPAVAGFDTGVPKALDAQERLMRIAHEVRSVALNTAPPQPAAGPSAFALLSPRECEIVQLLLDGERAPAIAERLVVSQSTVRNHLAASFKKLGVHSQQELLRRFWT